MKAQPNKHMTHCQYESSTGSVDIMVSDDWDMTNPFGVDKKSDTAVPGIGDEAYINDMGLRIRKGTRGLEIGATGAAGDYEGAAADAQNDLAKKLEIKTAKAIVGKL
jgi:hypothetical protein